MAKGIQLAGLAGAGGVGDALKDVIAQRLDEAKFAELKRAQQVEEAQREAAASLAREQFNANRALAMRQQERLERDAGVREGLTLATNFAGQRVPTKELEKYPELVRALMAKQVDPTLASKAITGFASMPGAPQAGAINVVEREAIEPGMSELQLPESERMRISEAQREAAAVKAEAANELAERRADETRRHNEAMEAIRTAAGNRSGSSRLVKRTFEDPDTGEVMEEYVSPEEARALGPTRKPKVVKPASAAERKAYGFYSRARDALANIERTSDGPSGLKLASLEDRIAKQGTFNQVRGEWAPNIAQTKDQQIYRQAQRALTEARLRADSGAAVPPTEYEADAKTYFFQPGDDAATIEQKRKGREAVIRGLRVAAGRALDEEEGSDTDIRERVIVGDPRKDGKSADPGGIR